MKLQNPTAEHREALELSQLCSTGSLRGKQSPNHNQTQGLDQADPSGLLFRWATQSIHLTDPKPHVPEQKALCLDRLPEFR